MKNKKNYFLLLFAALFLYSFNYLFSDIIKLRRSYLGPFISDYKNLECPQNPYIIVYFGQSNSSNTVRPMFSKTNVKSSFQYDWRTKKCFEYKEPLLGSNDFYSNSATPLVAELEKKIKQKILLVPLGVPGSSVLDWSYGNLSKLIDYSLINIRKQYIKNKIIFIFIQGEKDIATKKSELEKLKEFKRFYHYYPQRNELSYETYGLALSNLYEKVNRNFPDAIFGIIHSTRCNSEKYNPIRSAQLNLAKKFENVKILGDLDLIPIIKPYRYNGCRLSPKGAKALSKMILSSLNK
jgi:hypothetical protein